MTDEYVVLNLLGQIIDLDILFASRFNDDPKYLYNAAEKMGIAPENMKSLLDKMKYNAQMRNSIRESMLPQLQSDLIVMLGQVNPSKEQVESFGNLLVVNPNYMDNPEFYSVEALAVAGSQYNELVSSLQNVNVETIGYNK